MGSENELSSEEIKDLLLQAKELGVRELSLSGGEPFLRRDVLDISKFARDRCDMLVDINTNGLLLDTIPVDEVVNTFDMIIVSLDTLNERTYEKVRGVNGSFKIVTNGLGKLLKNRLHKSQVAVNCVVSSQNLDSIGELLRFGKNNDLQVLLQPVHNSPENSFVTDEEDAELTRFDELTVTEKWKEISHVLSYTNFMYRTYCKDYYDGIPLFLLKKKPKEFICFAGSFNFWVDPHGYVFPCEFLREKKWNIREKRLREIWNEMNDQRKQISSKQRSCFCWLLCSALPYLNLSKFTRAH